MHIFIVGWNLPKRLQEKARLELYNCHHVFPSLDKESLWSSGLDHSVFAASIQRGSSTIAPRVFRSTQNSTTILYHGCMVDPTNEFTPWDARELHKHWSDINRLEGLYVAIKISTDKSALEIYTDPLGVYQVYFARRDNSWIISNNITVIKNILEISDLDPVGVGMYLSLGWASGNKTLLKDIEVIPGGQHWKWKNNSSEPDRKSYYGKNNLLGIKHKRLSRKDFTLLSDQLGRYFTILENNFKKIECPITGGRDSRAMVALLMHQNLSANYFTEGEVNTEDAKIGANIANKFNLEYETRDYTIKNIIAGWPQLRDQFIAQNDGMVSLSCVYSAFGPSKFVDPMKIQLYGIGGEIGRAYYYNKDPRFLYKSFNSEYVIKRLRNLATSKDFISENIHNYADSFIDTFCQDALESGFMARDLPDLFYTFERVRRWAGTHIRPNWLKQDEFSPFCTRPYIEAAFSLPLIQREVGHIHYRLLSELVPALNAIPYDEEWKHQSSTILYSQKLSFLIKSKLNHYFGLSKNSNRGQKMKAYHHSDLAVQRTQILNAIVKSEREFCFDNINSPVWEFVNRENFLSLISTNAPPEKLKNKHEFVYLVLTLLHYVSSLQDRVTSEKISDENLCNSFNYNIIDHKSLRDQP